jgi:hypothetical protein
MLFIGRIVNVANKKTKTRRFEVTLAGFLFAAVMVYSHDKSHAERNLNRVSEKTLHTFLQLRSEFSRNSLCDALIVLQKDNKLL